ncbi:NifU family protein [Desulfosporosinus metallidurans]|uniref:Nitrogen fixation protein n=1 Tax=Desulfosporosinus metallidurans TaxID=1888891 RepID=A0A1Q8QDU3_9FIRM|nr:NifU family protein [Desulfosporosinus metallidurans]OLN25498.1 Nitrogen fixation protein [Desulfosporosinus metallidurans]
MKEIIDIIDRKIRPALNAHNGDISRVRETPEGFVKVRLTGACSTCPSSQQTLSEFIEAVIKAECPQIKGVISDCETSDDLISEALGILRKVPQ